jgi:hypothetical protein
MDEKRDIPMSDSEDIPMSDSVTNNPNRDRTIMNEQDEAMGKDRKGQGEMAESAANENDGENNEDNNDDNEEPGGKGGMKDEYGTGGEASQSADRETGEKGSDGDSLYIEEQFTAVGQTGTGEPGNIAKGGIHNLPDDNGAKYAGTGTNTDNTGNKKEKKHQDRRKKEEETARESLR